MPLTSAKCGACCSACLTDASPPPVRPVETPAYHLQNFFAVGTVELAIAFEDSTDYQLCSHTHAEDGWHVFDRQTFYRLLTTPTDDATLRQLEFLVKNRFLELTWLLLQSKRLLCFRVYMIPYDLPGVQGRLRRRDEHLILNPARKYLMQLLPRIVQDVTLWNDDCHRASGSVQKMFLPRTSVRLLLVEFVVILTCAVGY
jgi:hypothetical protein